MRKDFNLTLLFVSLMVGFIAIIVFNTKIAEAQIIQDGLVIYYSFNEDTVEKDEVKDLSENGNDGLIVGNLEVVDEGKVKEGMEFPGVATSYIAVRNYHYSKPDIEGITLAAWVKTDTRGMIASWDRSEFFRFAVGDDQLGNTEFVAFDTCCGIHDWHGKTKVADGDWHHVVATYDSDDGEKKIYVDGELDDSTSAHGGSPMGKAITRYGFLGVGSEAGGFNGGTGPTSFPFNGIMDEFVLYDRALNEEEIKQTFEAEGFSVTPAGKLILTWGEIKASR